MTLLYRGLRKAIVKSMVQTGSTLSDISTVINMTPTETWYLLRTYLPHPGPMPSTEILKQQASKLLTVELRKSGLWNGPAKESS